MTDKERVLWKYLELKTAMLMENIVRVVRENCFDDSDNFIEKLTSIVESYDEDEKDVG